MRARFYQLQGTAFPPPVYDLRTRRPVYTEELQQVCLEVRRRNCGIDGRRSCSTPGVPEISPTPNARRKPTQPKKSKYAEIVEGVQVLGLTTVTAAQVEAGGGARYKVGRTGSIRSRSSGRSS